MKYKKPKCKRKKFKVQVIKPLKRRCIKCGGRLEDHHLICSSCHSKRDKERHWKQEKNNSDKFYGALRLKRKQNGGTIIEKIEVEV